MARRRALRAHDRNVDVALDIEPLIGIVEDKDARALRAGFLGARQPIGIGHDDRPGHQTLMHGLLVAAIAPQQDPRLDAAPSEERRRPGRERRLSGSADR